MITQTKDTQAAITPDTALSMLKQGNQRFVDRKMIERDLNHQVHETSSGQYPFATVLHCIDSRVPAEMVFDAGIGDLFSIRVAGNFINEDILGSMEFASKLAGTKIIVVMGHTNCGAIKGACDHVKLGNMTAMLSKITPVVMEVERQYEVKGSVNKELVQEVADRNVLRALDRLRMLSPILADMESMGLIRIVGAMYDITTGRVRFN